MAAIWVRYDSGDTDEWELTDALVENIGVDQLMRQFGHSLWGVAMQSTSQSRLRERVRGLASTLSTSPSRVARSWPGDSTG